MRPFKFFFAISVGMILFFFLARVVIFAMIIAAMMSALFFVARKIKNFFHRMTWEEEDYAYARSRDYHRDHRPSRRSRRPSWKFDQELLVDDWEFPQRERVFAEQIIPVR